MSFIDVITAALILVVFFSGISPAFLPAWRAWEKAEVEYRTGRTIHFIAESFKNECAKPDRNIENWKKTVSAARELESLEVIELMEDTELRAMKARCVIRGEYIEIIALCSPREISKRGNK